MLRTINKYWHWIKDWIKVDSNYLARGLLEGSLNGDFSNFPPTSKWLVLHFKEVSGFPFPLWRSGDLEVHRSMPSDSSCYDMAEWTFISNLILLISRFAISYNKKESTCAGTWAVYVRNIAMVTFKQIQTVSTFMNLLQVWLLKEFKRLRHGVFNAIFLVNPFLTTILGRA